MCILNELLLINLLTIYMTLKIAVSAQLTHRHHFLVPLR